MGMADSQPPHVSIVTPVHNGARYIVETVESVLAQDYPHSEYLVLDDGSQDDTQQRLAPYLDRITLLSHPNMGEPRTVNRGVELAGGDVIAVVNADDPVLPGWLAAGVEALAARPELVGVYPDWLYIDAEGRTVRAVQTEEFDLRVHLEQCLCLPGPGAMFRKAALGGEPARDVRLRYNSDYEMWLRLGLRGPIARIPRTLATWRAHEGSGSISQRSPEMARNKIDMVRRFYAWPDIPESLRPLRRQALSTAYYCAGILAIYDRSVPGRAYLLRSLLTATMWPRHFLPVRRRRWLAVGYVLGSPITRWLYDVYGWLTGHGKSQPAGRR